MLKIALFFLCSLSLLGLNAQLSPKGQLLLDSMTRWMQIEIKTKGTIDTATLGKFNAAIRAAEAENKKKVKTNTGPTDGKIITKELMSGATLTVPDGMEWEIQHIYLKDEKSGYRIAVKSDLYPKIYKAGEKLHAPGYTAELALIDDSDNTQAIYIFEILETKR